jgi:hypothetical protein
MIKPYENNYHVQTKNYVTEKIKRDETVDRYNVEQYVYQKYGSLASGMK